LCFSQEESEEITDPVADRTQAVQVKAPPFPAAHPGFGFVQEGARFPGTGRPRPHWVL